MKTKIIIITGLALCTLKIGAQGTMQIAPSASNVPFTVQNPQNAATFNWSIAGTAHTTSPSGTGNSVTISFGATIGASSTLSVIPVSSNSCQGATRTLTITITNPAAMSYIATFSGVPANICPQTTNNPTGGQLAATVTITGTGSTAGVSALNPIKLSYTVDGTVAATPVNMSSASQIVTFPEVLTPGNHTYVITSVSFGVNSSASTASASSSVDAIPTVDGIF